MNFTEDKQTNLYTSILGNTPKGEADALVKTGGTSTTKFVPNVNVSKWSDEFWLNINNSAVKVTSEKQTYVDGKVDLIVGNDCHRYYIDANGNLEYEIVFSSQPGKPEILLDLQYSKGLDFIYQPALTDDEIAGGMIRPDNVVGSYAVYSAKQHNQYQTGKFCHIYRPYLVDAKGNVSWCSLFIDPSANTIQILMDEKWIKDANYPVILDPTFGYTTVGASTDTTPANTVCWAKSYTNPASNGTLTSVSAYIKIGSGTTPLNTAIYSDNSGAPNARLASAWPGDGTITTTSAWITSSLSYESIVAATQYWLGFANSAGTTTEAIDTISGTELVYKSGTSWPDSAGTTSNRVNRRFSIYGTYTESGGSSSFIKDIMRQNFIPQFIGGN